jgi:hypothetical protein
LLLIIGHFTDAAPSLSQNFPEVAFSAFKTIVSHPTIKLMEVILQIVLFTPSGDIPNLREKRSRWQTCMTIYSM